MRLSASSENFSIICANSSFLGYDKKKDSSFVVYIALQYYGVPSKPVTDQCEKEKYIGCAISTCEKYVAIISSHKNLLLYANFKGECSEDWELIQVWTVVKRPTDVLFDVDSSHILVADKTGNVLRIAVPSTQDKFNGNIISLSHSADDEEEEKGHPLAPILLGHMSILLSMCVSPDGKYLITGDRDERIKVSHYPHSHVIESYCLGHREFVSQLAVLPSHPSILVSASGDGILKLWQLSDGEMLFSLETHEMSKSLRLQPDSIASSSSSADSSSRDRVIPGQCAVTTMAVVKRDDKRDLVACGFDASLCVAIFKYCCSQLDLVTVVQPPMPALTLLWMSQEDLMTVCLPPSTSENKVSSMQMWEFDAQLQATKASRHKFSAFCKEECGLLSDLAKMDTTILYKERYDNMAEYKEKKEKRIQQQKLKQLAHEDQRSKKIKLEEIKSEEEDEAM